jgi:CrcB protein
MAALALGGALGTLARFGVERAAPPAAGGFPWATFTVNVTGSFVLGVVVALVLSRWPGDRYLRPFAAVGFCGGFTTFSTLMVEIDQRVGHGHTAVAVAYLTATLLAGLGAAVAGIAVGGGHISLPGRAIADPDLLSGDEPVGPRADDGPRP